MGEFSLFLDGIPHTAIDTVRLRTLFAYLLLKRGTALQRSRLAFQFWPDSTEKQALTNFRHLLHALRKALPEADSFIEANTKTIEWTSDVNVEVDVDLFKAADSEGRLACKRGDIVAASLQFERAVELYAGDLLPGHFDDWLCEQRDELSQQYADALQAAVACLESRRKYAEAIRFCQTLCQYEPTREKSYCSLMRLYSLNGDRAKALRVYRDCETALRKELDVSPSQRTNELYQKLLKEEPLEAPVSQSHTVVSEPELPLFGRDEEWRMLQECWRAAFSGHAHLLVLIGEAGIGKSRLAEELYVSLSRQGAATCKTRSYSAEGRLAYAPVCQWMRSDVLRPSLSKIEPVWLAEIARIMPELRGEFSDLPESSAEQGNWQRHLLFEALSRAVLAKDEPVMLLLDDMQWTDQESLEWLRFLLRFAPTGRLLILGTIREEELVQDHPLRRLMLELSRDGQLTEMELGPISSDDAALIAAGVAGHDLSNREKRRLYETTEGNPLFVVESVRAGLRNRSETSLDSYEGLELSATVPPKVHAVFTTRLSQLSAPALELSRIAAVFGRAFTIEMLVEVSGRSEDENIGLLDELWEKRIIREQEAGLYDFTHDKLREVSYEQISTPKRRLLHKKSSDVLERFFANDLGVVMAQLASHYEESGQASKAIEAYRKAGVGAKELNATQEAIRLFEKALVLLSRQEENAKRLEQELEINTDLGTCLVAEFGYHEDRVEQLYERSEKLCSLLRHPTLPPILRALALYRLTNGKLIQTVALGEELSRAYEETQENILYVESEYVLGVAKFWLGQFQESLDHLQRSLERYDPSQLNAHLSHYAQDPKAICICRLAWCHYIHGLADQAIETVSESYRIATEMGHPHTEIYILYFGGQVCVSVGDFDLAMVFLERFEKLKAEHELPFWASRAGMLRGYIGVVRDGDESAFKLFEENFNLCVGIAPTISLSLFLSYYAELCLLMGQPEKAIDRLETYRGSVAMSDERFYDADLLRQEGDVLSDLGREFEEVEELYNRALKIARSQNSLMLELRAATSLAKLWSANARESEAKQLLGGVYDRFEEGFSHRDLVAAKTLLDRIS